MATNMDKAAALLEQYDKKKRSRIATNADGTNDSPDVAYNKRPSKLGTWSFTNPYNDLYDEISQDQNFNPVTWETALSRGEQDMYISFLRQNAGTKMSDQFYETQYYDYETQMLELYKNFATGEAEDRGIGSVWDDETGGWTNKSLGEMTEKEYIEYQLATNYKNIDQLVQLDIERQHKENLGFWGRLGNDVGAFFAEFGEGILQFLVNAVDFFAAPVDATIGSLFYGEDWIDAYINYYADESLTALEREHVRTALDEWERRSTDFRDVETGEYTTVGQYIGGMANSIGYMVPSIVLNIATAGASSAATATASGLAKATSIGSKLLNAGSKIASFGTKWIGMGSFYAGIYSGRVYENAVNPELQNSPNWLKVTNAFVTSAAEAVIEVALGKFLGGTIQNQLIGITGRSAFKSLSTVTKGRAVAHWFKSAAQEGLEEFLQDFSTNLVNQFTGMYQEGYEKTGVTFQTLVDSFFMGAATSLVLGVGTIAGNKIQSIVTKGRSDLYIEQDNNLVRVGGFRRIYMQSILNDFNEAVDKLKSGKISEANIELAQEVYAAYTNMTQLYASFSPERIKNAETLLSRVLNADKQEMSGDTRQSVMTTIRSALFANADKIGTTELNHALTEYAETLERDIREMIGGAPARFVEKAVKLAKENREKFVKGGVTTVNRAIDKDGEVYAKDPVLKQIEDRLLHKYEKLRKDYEWIFTIDGHVALDGDNILFVPEAWLENYEVSDIYKFLEQEKVIDGLLTDKSLHNFIEAITDFNKDFTGRANIDSEQALMDFLFNESVYKAFILKNNGENLFKYKDLVFNVLSFIDVLVDEKSLTQERKHFLEQVRERIKATWRRPTLLAIINWNITPQLVGADYILSDIDRQFVKEHKALQERKKNAINNKTVSADYANETEALVNLLPVNVQKTVRDGLKAPARSRERTLAVLMLDIADASFVDSRAKYKRVHKMLELIKQDIAWFMAAAQSKEVSLDEMKQHANNLINSVILSTIDDINTYNRISTLLNAFERDIMYAQEAPDITIFFLKHHNLFTTIITICEELENAAKLNAENKHPVFTLSTRAMSDMGLLNAADAELIQDAVNVFIDLYGTTPELLLEQNFVDMSQEQFNRLQADMVVSGFGTNVEGFVIAKLESLLGPEYVAVQTVNIDAAGKIKGHSYVEMFAELQTATSILQKIVDGTATIVDAKRLQDELYKLTKVAQFAENNKNDKLFSLYGNSDRLERLGALFAAGKLNKSYVSLIEDFLSLVSDAFAEWRQSTQHKIGGYVIAKSLPAKGIIKPAFFEGNIQEQNSKLISLLQDGAKPISEILNLDTSKLGPKLAAAINQYLIVMNPTGQVGEAYTDNHLKKIVINMSIDKQANISYLDILAHELNHVFQYLYHMPTGGNIDMVLRMPDYMAYIMNTYPEAVDILINTNDRLSISYVFEKNHVYTADDMQYLSSDVKQKIAYVGYKLIQGEIWAEKRAHNPTAIGVRQGILRTDKGTAHTIITPDRQTFVIPAYLTISPIYKSNSISENVQANLLETTFINAIETQRNASDTKNFHTGLSVIPAKTVVNDLMGSIKDTPNVSLVERGTVTIDQIIKNPQKYLKPEFASIVSTFNSEGQVYAFLRNYIERKYFNAVSIDRSANTHEYVLVDNEAFDALHVDSVKQADNASTSLVDKYKGKAVKISEFYNKKALTNFGAEDVTVYIADNVQTQTIFNKKFPNGLIVINGTNITNEQLINKLNHEFRHVMQYYFNLEGGFTTDFNVTNEMLTDIKAHAPNIFELAKKYYDYSGKTQQEWEVFVAQRFIYFLVGGEQNAFGMSALQMLSRPVYVDTNGKNITIYMPWYDGNSKSGRYDTSFTKEGLAHRTQSPKAVERITKNTDTKKAPTFAEDTIKEFTPEERKQIAEAENAGIMQRKGKKGIIIPRKTTTHKYTRGEIENIDETNSKKKYIYDNPKRYFTKEEADKSNLKYFYKKGTHNEMAPELKDFIVKTTGHEEELPKTITNAIKKGKLTQQAIYKWLQNVDLKTVNQYTFDAINDSFFHNEQITTPEELNKVAVNAQLWYAASLVLKREGIDLAAIVAQNDINTLLSAMTDLSNGEKFVDALEKATKKYQAFSYMGPNGKRVYEELDMNNVEAYMRTLAMKMFDGSLGSAFYVANAARKALLRRTLAERKSIGSTNETITRGKGDDSETAIEDTLTEENIIRGDDNTDIGNDIIALYELDTMQSEGKSVEEMIRELGIAAEESFRKKYTRIAKKKYPDISAQKLKNAVDKKVREETTNYVRKLLSYNDEQIAHVYNRYLEQTLTTEQPNMTLPAKVITPRTTIVAQIKRYATQLLALVNGKTKGKYKDVVVIWNLLPQEVKDLFQEEEVTVRGTKTVTRTLKPEAYSVGRGAVSGKRNFAEEQDLTHDTTQIVKNRDLLRDVLSDARKQIYANQENVRKMSKAERELQRRNRELARKWSTATKKEINETDVQNADGMNNTEIDITDTRPKKSKVKKREVSDTPNNFTIISAEPMPDIMKKIFDVSFADMADNRVQFASVDENGELYDKQNSPKDFQSRLQHEVTSWEAFYDANRDTLLGLTRTDVENIVDFIEGGVATFNGPANKLAAFQIFTLGFIIDAAQRNLNNWNFSNAEIQAMRELYERIAGAHGSGLNAAGQMLSIVNPYKKVQQHMLEDYNIGDAELQPLINSVEGLQNAKDKKSYEQNANNIAAELRSIERRMLLHQIVERYEGLSDRKKAKIDRKYDITALEKMSDDELRNLSDKDFYKRVPWLGNRSLYERIKSFRYLSMLSSPLTWARNVISNVVQTGLTGAANAIGKIVLPKKFYRADQYDLSRVKVSDEVKNFIRTAITNNDVFEALYDNTTKYDDRGKPTKKGNVRKNMFITMIVRSLEKKYAANHRFDTVAMNRVSRFINDRISDKRFIRYAATRYLGKLLQIKINNGEIDLSQGLTNEVLDTFADAVVMANDQYMHKRSFLADMLDGLRDKHPYAYEVLSWWQPFLNSGFNWFGEMLKYTPAGMIRAIWNITHLENRIARAKSNRESGLVDTDPRVIQYLAAQDIGKGVIGLIGTITGALLAAFGVLKIDEDDDKFYMTVGDVKVDISNIFGTSSILIGAALTIFGLDNDQDGEPDYSAADILGIVADYITEGFILKDIIDRHKWDSGMYEALLTETESILRSFVPQIIQLIVRATNNENIRYSSGFMGMLERWLNTFIPTQPFGERKINPYTGEVSTKYAIPVFGELLKGGLFGPKIFWEDKSEMEEYARSLGVNKGMLTSDKLTSEDGKSYDIDNYKLNEKYGQLNSATLANIAKGKYYVQMPDGSYKTLSWDKMSDEQKANVIDRLMRQNADLAKIWYWTQILHKKYYASASLYKAAKEAGITKNVYRGDRGFAE